MFDTKTVKEAKIRLVFHLSLEEFERAKPYIGEHKKRHYWAKKAFLEKLSRMEVTDKKAREQRIIADAAYINKMIEKGLIKWTI